MNNFQDGGSKRVAWNKKEQNVFKFSPGQLSRLSTKSFLGNDFVFNPEREVFTGIWI